jgi:chorismate mutase
LTVKRFGFTLEMELAKRERLFNIRLSDREYQLLERYAASLGVSMSDVVRDFIKSLVRKLPKEDE